MLNTPPPIAPPFDTPRETEDSGVAHPYDAILIAFAVTLVGVVGFLGLLIAGSLTPRAATPLRAVAVVWFAVFGVWHVKAKAKIP